MEPRVERDDLIQALDTAHGVLDRCASSYPALLPSSRALRRLSQMLLRPFRLAVLGESNSGKSTVANLIAGETALPALPVANTRLPALLYYAPIPRVDALYENGERLALTSRNDFPARDLVRLDVGLPSQMLRRVEILDFPGSANPLFHTDVSAVLRHGIDAAIWTTVATQAWRETERFAWSGLPERIRRRGLLAVTHCDLISGEEDLQKLKSRLWAVAEEYFSALCFVSAAGRTWDTSELFLVLGRLADRIEKDRVARAALAAGRVAAGALSRLEGPGLPA
jgi:hypothetical protein